MSVIRRIVSIAIAVGVFGLRLYAVLLGIALLFAILAGTIGIIGRLLGYNWL